MHKYSDEHEANTMISESGCEIDLERGVNLFNDVFRERAAAHRVDLLLYGTTLNPAAAGRAQLDYLVLPRNGPRMRVRICGSLLVRAAQGSRRANRRLRAECDRMLLRITTPGAS